MLSKHLIYAVSFKDTLAAAAAVLAFSQSASKRFAFHLILQTDII